MEEFVLAVRAVWQAWDSGERLAFRGDFYKHTLMTDFFSPGPNPYRNPPVFLAAVGDMMAAVAGRVADGLIVHPLTSAQYLREKTVPALLTARDKPDLSDFTMMSNVLVVLGADEAERSRAEQAVRKQIAFYASTPSYRPVLELHGWGELADQLNALSRRQAWAEMTALIPDDMLDTFSVSGDVARGLRERFGGLIDRISVYTPYDVDPALVTAVRTELS
jgi:probable F420-dependent oxidoreductase